MSLKLFITECPVTEGDKDIYVNTFIGHSGSFSDDITLIRGFQEEIIFFIRVL